MTCEFVQITQRILRRKDVSCIYEPVCPMEEKCAFVRNFESFALLDSEEFARRLDKGVLIDRAWIDYIKEMIAKKLQRA